MSGAATTPSVANGYVLAHAADGSVIMRSERALEPYPATVCGDLVAWAERDPAATLLAVRAGDGWATLTYGEMLARVRRCAAALLRSPAGADAPIAILAENSLESATLILAALYAGIPFAPISAGYAAPTADPARVRDLFAVLQPGLIFAGDAAIAERLRTGAGATPIVTRIDEANDVAAADAAFARVGPDTVAKIMFTSGSTGTPKGVITTNRMLAANQTQTTMAWPELTYARPVIVDWLPWSHVMGGSHIFGMVLRNGGTLYVDAGRPVGGAFAESVRTLSEIPPTMFFSVPRGFVVLLEALRADDAFARIFFSRLRALGNAAAALPNNVRDELIRLARTYGGSAIRITSSWGMTETAPMATTSWGAVDPDTDTIGTPAAGVEIKLAPVDGRNEIRVKGPNVTPGYWRNADATRAAFDADGFFRTGDAASLKDPADVARGLLFEGRLAENFKLDTGTWVNVGALRLSLIDRGAPAIEDVVLTGHDRSEIGVLVFLRADGANEVAGSTDADHAALAADERVRGHVAHALADHNAAMPASSTRITRALILPAAPDRSQGEITDKGSINQRRALAHRAEFVARLHAAGGDPDVILPQRRVVGS